MDNQRRLLPGEAAAGPEGLRWQLPGSGQDRPGGGGGLGNGPAQGGTWVMGGLQGVV